MNLKKTIILVSISLTIIAPLSALAFYKPIRVIIPEIFGINCQYDNLCVEDNSKLFSAIKLVKSSKTSLENNWGLIVGNPKIIFCSTDECKETFGLSKAAGYTVGTFGIIITPRGWKEHYVSHELIHFWQANNYGSYVLISSKSWVIEGMAYGLSGDPRKVLSEPFQSYRSKYLSWHKDIPIKDLKTKLASIM